LVNKSDGQNIRDIRSTILSCVIIPEFRLEFYDLISAVQSN